ncbi:ABC transporter ATP-binding protein [Glaciihabitans sp. dw_435]|uniref:ATP-binding cassette domain-containing protein n=1 Tax=Glaciihabitans sp. dw_435 TaxID=2720081 RepID=UPI001BD21698|nr:ABC transporter ATP-binding protein [Glaciihabitans sp. dw_435]
MTDNSPLLGVNGLTIRGGGRTLVDDLSLAIGRGERLGLIGESGSGKSLTALAIAGLLPTGLRAEGSLKLDGMQVIGARERDLRSLRGRASSTVFQEPLTALDPLMKLGRQLAEPLRRRAQRDGERMSRDTLLRVIHSSLTDVALPDPDRIANSYPHEVSGGQRQRVALAMALATNPLLLIADEPTTALDVTVQGEILDLLARVVAERQMALLFISHDLAVVSRVVDHVVVLKDGVAVERGPIAELLRSPEHEYTRSLVAGARAFDDALGRIS